MEWGADYPKWNPEDLAKRFGWYRREEKEGKALQRAQEIRANDPTLRSQPPRMPPPPKPHAPPPKPGAPYDHWLQTAHLIDMHVEVLYKVIETKPKAGISKKKRKTEEGKDGIRVIATFTKNPNGSNPDRVVLRCAVQSMLPQKNSRLDLDLCEPIHPGGRFGNFYRLYAFRGPNEGEFMRPLAHQKDSNGTLMHLGIWVDASAGNRDVAKKIVDGKPQPIVFRDEDCVLVKDSETERLLNGEWEQLRGGAEHDWVKTWRRRRDI